MNSYCGGICAETSEFGVVLDDQGGKTYSVVQYTSGRNDTVYYQYGTNACSFSVNGEDCRACGYFSCDDGSLVHYVDCGNVISGNDINFYNGCDPAGRDYGVFEALYLYDYGLDANCPLVFYTTSA